MLHDQDSENARAGYQAAIDLWTNEGQTFWAKFNAMLVANSFILASIGLTISAGRRPVLLPLVGIGLCLVWLCIAARSYGFQNYWIYSAREMEQSIPPAKMAVRGRLFAAGKKVRFRKIGREEPKLQMNIWGKLRVESASYLLIFVFIAIYMMTIAVPNWAFGSEEQTEQTYKVVVTETDKEGEQKREAGNPSTEANQELADFIKNATFAFLLVILAFFVILQIKFLSMWKAKTTPIRKKELTERKLAATLSVFLFFGLLAFFLLLLYILLRYYFGK